MSTEALVGVIGLAGAAIGAAAAFAGVVYQQKHEAKLARVERLDTLAEAAVDTLMTELEKLRDLAWSLPSDDSEPPEWIEAMARHIAVISLAALRLPDQKLRESIDAACIMGFGQVPQFQAHIGLHSRRILMTAMCRDAQRCLGAYLRQEAIPKTEFLDKAQPFFQSMIDRRPD